MPQKPLLPEEIRNDEIRKLYDFKHQDPRGTGKVKNLWIERTCVKCGNKRWVKVNWVRRSAQADTLSGFCLKCSGYRNKGKPRRGETFKGGKRKNSQGYIEIIDPDKRQRKGNGTIYIKEHRHIMKNHLGRPLLKTESIHHLNGKKDDNRIENLEIWTTLHPAGQRASDLVVFAKEILTLYGDL